MSKFTALLDLLIVAIEKANRAISKSIAVNLNGAGREAQINLEKSLLKDYFMQINEADVDFKSVSISNDKLLKLLALLSNIPTSYFKIIVLANLINDLFLKLVKNLDESHVRAFFKCCQIKLNTTEYYYDGDQYDSVFFQWKKAISYLSQNDVIICNHITCLQDFFE